MILPVLNVCAKDEQLALSNLKVCRKLDGNQDADLLIVHPTGFDVSKVADLAKGAFARIQVECYPEWRGDQAWPKPQNWAWQRVARLVAKEFSESKYYSGWLWWEADAVPCRKGWLKALSNQFAMPPRAPFGGVACEINGDQYMNGVGIYPMDVIPPLANCSSLYALNVPFDMAAGVDVMRAFKSMEPLMQHTRKDQGGGTGRVFTEIPANAAFVHGCTDGSLQAIILETKVSAEKVTVHQSKGK